MRIKIKPAGSEQSPAWSHPARARDLDAEVGQARPLLFQSTHPTWGRGANWDFFRAPFSACTVVVPHTGVWSEISGSEVEAGGTPAPHPTQDMRIEIKPASGTGVHPLPSSPVQRHELKCFSRQGPNGNRRSYPTRIFRRRGSGCPNPCSVPLRRWEESGSGRGAQRGGDKKRGNGRMPVPPCAERSDG